MPLYLTSQACRRIAELLSETARATAARLDAEVLDEDTRADLLNDYGYLRSLEITLRHEGVTPEGWTRLRERTEWLYQPGAAAPASADGAAPEVAPDQVVTELRACRDLLEALLAISQIIARELPASRAASRGRL